MNPLGGRAWQALRSRCLDSVPSGSSAPFGRPTPLHVWRSTGAFRVDSCTKREIVLETPGVDVGGALLSDCEHLLDHAAEHHALLEGWAEDRVWHSPGWSVVTVYYWGFFLGMAFTRLAGRTSWYLTREALANLRVLSGSALQPPAGALDLTVERYLTATNRHVRLCPAKKQLHEAMWRNLGRIFADISQDADQVASPLEYRALECLGQARTRISDAWPSSVRNAVNYLPGCGYREVLRRTDIDIASYLRKSSPLTGEKIVSEFEDHLLQAGRPARPTDDVPLFSRLLLLFTLLLAGVTTSLHREIVDRNSLDSRWGHLRNKFLRDRKVLRGQVMWPFAD